MNTHRDYGGKESGWELKLGAIQLVVILGLVTGSMAAAFYLGFSSGQHVGYESALKATEAQIARLPIPVEEIDDAANQIVASEVYEKLALNVPQQVQRKELQKPATGEINLPELGAIPSVGSEPADNPGSLVDSVPVLKSEDEEIALDTGVTAMASPELSKVPPTKTGATAGKETLGAVAREAESTSSAKSKTAEIITVKGNERVEKKTESIAVMKATATPEKTNIKPSEEKVLNVVATPEVKPTAKPVVKEPTPAPVKEKKSSSLLRSVIPSGWYVQVAAPRKVQDADELAKQLSKRGYDVLIESAQVRGEEYFRILVGPASNRAAAEKVLGSLKKESVVRGDPFVRAVK